MHLIIEKFSTQIIVLIPSLNTYFKFWCQIIIYVLIFHIYVQPWWNLKLHKRKNSSNGADFLWNAQQPLIEIKIACKGNVSMQIVQNIIKKHVGKNFKTMQPFQFNLLVYRKKKKKNLWPHVRVTVFPYHVTVSPIFLPIASLYYLY